MSSEATQQQQQEERSRFFEFLMNSRNRDNIGFFMHFLNQEAQNMVVIVSNNNNIPFESLLDELIISGKKGQPPASKASIEALPVVEIDANVEQQCVVCLEEWSDGEKGIEMPCKHKFHKGCVEKWLNIHGSCPVCRYQMPVDEKTNLDDVDQRNENEDGERRESWVWLTFGGRRINEESQE